MADCFISYRRMPSAPVATALQSKLESKHGIDAYVDTTRTDGTTVRFPERLMTAIADAPVFVCLLGERDGQHTLESDWVLKEIQQAYDLGKFCIPVFQESYRPLSGMPPAVEYLLGFDGIHILDQKNIMIDESVRQIADLIHPHRKKYLITPLRLGAVIIVTLVVITMGLAVAFSGLIDLDNTPVPTNPAVAQNATDAPSPQPTLTLTQTPVIIPTQTAILSKTEVEGTVQAEMNAIVLDNIRTAESGETATAAVLSMTATQWTATPTVDTRATAEARLTETQAWIDSWTPTPTITPTPTLSPEEIALTPQTANADWTPVERDFDGVTMVLVPAGCFMMGNTDYVDEQPVHEICFDEPFWMDKHEVTQRDFFRLGGTQANAPGFSGDERPVERITWFEARDFCELREARLPTEAEWEYAARGPDNLLYPWGDTWKPNNPVWNGTGWSETANVGSIHAGDSWVGALDMSGNVWEWTSSLYESYPYDLTDGREADTGVRMDVLRVLRGGSWNSDTMDNLGTPNRLWYGPNDQRNYVGFRCVRSYE